MTRLAIIAAVAAVVLGALTWAAVDIRGAYADRAALTDKVAALEARIAEKDAAIQYAIAERDQARLEAAAEIDRMQVELATRERIATEAAARARRIQGDLDRANVRIRDLAQRPEYDACLSLPLPGGVLERPAAGVPTAEVDGYRSPAADQVPRADPGAGHPTTIGDAVVLAPYLQAAFRLCEGDKASLRSWTASAAAANARGSP